MATTPPLQITGTPRTPPTPLHGASYEESPRRTSARLRQKRALDDSLTQPAVDATHITRTPGSPRASRFVPRSPDRTPQQKSISRRVQIMSPTSDSDTSAPKPAFSRLPNSQTMLSVNTTLNDGMLPTPVKTPNKKHKTINKSNLTARALFQDQLADEEMVPSPKRNRKNKRYNGFSLESFRAEDGGRSGIQVFTDSRDQVPEMDQDKDNPFVESEQPSVRSRKVAGSTKRRKVSETKKLDPQVEEALQNDEGMVYVFRGKKVYRRFDDTGEEEEEIDAEDLGLLGEHADGARIIRPLRTLTRKSIKPTRLFQTEEQKRARELEREEEATTDIEEPLPPSTYVNEEHSIQVKTAKKPKGRGKATSTNSSEVNGKAGSKNGSPFDTWRRLKPGSGSSSSAAKETRGRKRAASPSFEEPSAVKA